MVPTVPRVPDELPSFFKGKTVDVSALPFLFGSITAFRGTPSSRACTLSPFITCDFPPGRVVRRDLVLSKDPIVSAYIRLLPLLVVSPSSLCTIMFSM